MENEVKPATDPVKKQSPMMIVELSMPKIPVFAEPRGGEGLIKAGDDNLWFDYLIYLYENSPKHNSIINHKVRYATSNGFGVKSLGKAADHVSGFMSLINKKNDKGDNLNRLAAKCDLDYEIFNGFALQMIWTKDGKSCKPFHLPFNLVRGFIEKGKLRFCYLPNWKNVNNLDSARDKDGYKEFDLFGTSNRGEEIIYYREFRPVKSGETDVYPMPYYLGTIPYIECDIEIAQYCVNGIYNDFGGSKVVTFFNGEPNTPELKASIESRFKRKHAGAKNARKVIINFVDNKEQKPEFDTLDTEGLGEQFTVLNEQVRDEVFTAHNITNPAIFGIPSQAAFSRTDLKADYDQFNSIWTKPRQNTLACEFESMFTAQGLVPDLYLNPFSPYGIVLSENVIVQVLDAEDLKDLAYKQVGITRKKEKAKTTLSSNEVSLSEREENLKHLGESSANEQFNFIDSFRVELNGDGYPIHSDSGFKAMYLAKIFDLSLTDLEAEIISAYAGDPKLTIEQLAEALDASTDEVIKVVDKLKGLKILSGEPGKSVKITKKGEAVIEENDKPLNIEVEYTYSDEGAPPLEKGSTSRSFCKKIMEMARAGKTWTRQQIERMKNSEGLSAWIYRGGFYHNPEEGETTPFCRHHWKAVIKKRKG